MAVSSKQPLRRRYGLPGLNQAPYQALKPGFAGTAVAGMGTQAMSVRIEQLTQSLDWSHQVSQEACRVLDQYCNQLGDLERTVQPVVLRTQALIQTRENIKQARAQAEEVLDHLDASRKVMALRRPHTPLIRPFHEQLTVETRLACRWKRRYYKGLTMTSCRLWQRSTSWMQLSPFCRNTGAALSSLYHQTSYLL